jgi:hypothetical protein
MNLIKFAETELQLNLTYFQYDLLQLLEQDPDAWQRKLKPTTFDVRLVLEVYHQWKERQNSLVAC